MAKNFYIADTHFGHANCIRFDDRPFETIEEHDETLIRNWNSVVTAKDHVYVLGDFAYRNKCSVSDYVKKLKGHIHLIRGNHDKKTPEYEMCFESVHDILVVRDMYDGIPCQVILCHYWIPFAPYQRNGAFVLHGHTHNSKEYRIEEELKKKIRQNGIRCEAYNVGCMHQGYFPMILDQIIKKKEEWDEWGLDENERGLEKMMFSSEADDQNVGENEWGLEEITFSSEAEKHT